MGCPVVRCPVQEGGDANDRAFIHLKAEKGVKEFRERRAFCRARSPVTRSLVSAGGALTKTSHLAENAGIRRQRSSLAKAGVRRTSGDHPQFTGGASAPVFPTYKLSTATNQTSTDDTAAS